MQTLRMKRPLGVTLLALTCFFGAGLGLFGLAQSIISYRQLWRGIPTDIKPGFSWWELLSHPIALGIVMFAFAIFSVRLGLGLWKLQEAARVGYVILTALTILTMGGVQFLLFLREPIHLKPSPIDLISMMGVVGFNLLLVLYLCSPGIRQAFSKHNKLTDNSG